MATPGRFTMTQLAPGVRLFAEPVASFKRTTLAAFVHHPLDAERVAALGLLPRLLRRGNTRWPSSLELERALAGLYGARLGTGVSKFGDRQILSFSLNLPADRYAGAALLNEGVTLLLAVMFQPVREGNGFRREYVEQEKHLQVGRIRALINNKSSYARFRCVQEMYPNEPFRLYELGTEEAVQALTAEGLLDVHRELVARAPVDFYAVGDVDVEALAATLRRGLQGMLPAERETAMPGKTRVAPGAGEPRTVVEEEAMGQGWLAVGLRTGVTLADPDRWAMQFFNGVLGGFVHSKMFINVRERASLAYSAFSGYDANKGFIVAMAGIDPGKYEQALEITLRQIDEIRRGEVSDEELEATRRGLSTRVLLNRDDAMGRMTTHLMRSVEGVEESADEALAAIQAVRKDDVVRMADRVRLDTIYFLKGTRAAATA